MVRGLFTERVLVTFVLVQLSLTNLIFESIHTYIQSRPNHLDAPGESDIWHPFISTNFVNAKVSGCMNGCLLVLCKNYWTNFDETSQ